MSSSIACRDQSLVSPPSHCPRCNHRLAWNDNIPVLGWILLRGKCRYCGLPISPRYPIIEAITGLLFAGYYVAIFIFRTGPALAIPPSPTLAGFGTMTNINQDWPIFGLYLFTVSSLLAASLIDAELFIIPLEITWLLAGIGILVHTIIDRRELAGNLLVGPSAAAVAAGGAVGLVISLVLWKFGIIPGSFPKGEPILEVDHTEMFEKEIAEAEKSGEAPSRCHRNTPRARCGERFARRCSS